MTTRMSFPVLLLCAVSLIFVSRVRPASVADLRVAVTDAAAPVLEVVSRPFATASDMLNDMTGIRELRAENIRLKEENARLREWYEVAMRLDAENKSLRDFLNLKKDPELSYITTRVIADPGGSYVRSVLVPAGSKQGVRKGQAVLGGEGLAGRITETGRHSARVLLITDLNSRIPVMIQNTRHKGILAGQNTGTLKLDRLPPDSGVEPGARVVTSGHGGMLPPDLPVGVITNVSPEGGVEVRPLSNLERLGHIQIVDYEVDMVRITGDLRHDFRNGQ